jgi:hypothetical protein
MAVSVWAARTPGNIPLRSYRVLTVVDGRHRPGGHHHILAPGLALGSSRPWSGMLYPWLTKEIARTVS